jgi:hypothetical protein
MGERQWKETHRGEGEDPFNAEYAIGGSGLVEMTADVRRDGCVHLRRYFNGAQPGALENGDDVDYIHICDLSRLIEELQALHSAAVKIWGATWPG